MVEKTKQDGQKDTAEMDGPAIENTTVDEPAMGDKSAHSLSKWVEAPQSDGPMANKAEEGHGLRQGRIPLLSIRGAIVAGTIAGVLYGVNFGLQVLVGIFRMTGASGFISGITVPFFLVIASRLNKQWGTATVIWTLYSALAIPTALMGTPGTYKLVVGVLGGMAYDIAFCGLKCRPWALYPALLMYVLFLDIGFYLVYSVGLMPEVAGGSILRVLAIVSAVFLVEGMLSTWLANRFYSRRLLPMGR